jgi:glycosyltransferase involved in cell wall biosynthesis
VAPQKDVTPLSRVLYAVILDPSQKFGSIEEQIAILARAFEDQGSLFLPLFIVSDPPEKLTPLEKHGVKIECLDLGRFRFKTLWRLLGLIKRHRIDIVHWNFSAPLANSYLWGLTLCCPRLEHFFTDHNSRVFPLAGAARGPKKLLKRLLLKRYARVMCVSQFVLDCLAVQNTWSNLVCARHFINTARFQPDAETRASLRRAENVADKFVLLTVAHLIPAKGVDVAVRALAELPAAALLWVVGTGPEAGPLQDLADKLKLTERVRFLGLHSNVEPYMQAADCFLCPSLWAEAAGLVNLEAQASGLPVIASRIGGISEYMLDGQTGFLFPPGDAPALAVCVRRLMADPALTRKLSEAAQSLARAQFSPEARLPELLAIYQRKML